MLDAEERAVLRESLALVHERLEPLSMAFYDNLFAVAPQMRGLFRDDLGGQGMRFMTTLVTIAELVDRPEAFDAAVAGLARAHARFGVRPEHYPPMGTALLVTLGETLGPGFTEARRRAWRAAYHAVADAMAAHADPRADPQADPKAAAR
jgi:hemoglobin-like flavoprotein